MLYKFEKLNQKLSQLGYPEIELQEGYQVIKADFEMAFKKGDIKVDEDGIRITYEGKEYKGYMFIREYHISRFKTFPKFHLVRCETIDSFILNGRFNQRYEFSNAKTNDVYDIDTEPHTIHKDKVLRLCKNCVKMIEDEIKDTNDFFENLGIKDVSEDIEIDIEGYVKDWHKISREYRKLSGYKCESCNIKIDNRFDQRFLHVHHHDGDKTNNNKSNLKCLCILCHAHIDSTHKSNFNKSRNKHELNAFIKKYKEELIKCGNNYISVY